jgi:pyruvate dehydrogenase E1 component alpha subunit/2-oxoisovalerate dehydrogenase E1 component alpha subunit
MPSLSKDDLEHLYRQLVRTRALEDRLENLVRQGEVTGSLYRSLGQEATAVGCAFALQPQDWLAPASRDLGACLVRGVPPLALLLQYTGRAAAPGRGRDDSLRFTDPERGVLGSVGPLGAALCVLNGIALTFKIRDQSRVCMAFLGDGATRTGAAHEGLSFAAAQRLPLVVVIEHNHWAFGTSSETLAAVQDWTNVAKAYGAPAIGVDGNDAIRVFEAAREAVSRARSGLGITFLVAETYRMKGHAQHDGQEYVSENELRRWKERDPIQLLEQRLLEQRLFGAEELGAFRDEIDAELSAAVSAALAEPLPDPETPGSGVYAAPDPADIPWTRDLVPEHGFIKVKA